MLVSASNRTDAHRENPGALFGRVGYDKFDGYWSEADEIGVYRVTKASDGERRGAVRYALNYYNRHFNFATDRWANNYFYCSKLVWRGWYSQGYDLEPKVCSITGIPWIRYLEFWRWNYKRVFGIKIYYPEFRWVWLRDIWVTPTDLTKTGYTHQVKRYHK